MSDSWVPIDITPASGKAKQAEPADPYLATAVGLVTPGHDGLAAMARTFVEEFALMGWSRQRIERMFRIPRYVAAHTVYQQRGLDFVRTLIDDVLGPPTTPTETKAS